MSNNIYTYGLSGLRGDGTDMHLKTVLKLTWRCTLGTGVIERT